MFVCSRLSADFRNACRFHQKRTTASTAMIAHAARFATILCAALLAACPPVATDARTLTPVLHGGLSTSVHQKHNVSFTTTSSAASTGRGRIPVDSSYPGPHLRLDPTCDAPPPPGRIKCAPPVPLQPGGTVPHPFTLCMHSLYCGARHR